MHWLAMANLWQRILFGTACGFDPIYLDTWIASNHPLINESSPSRSVSAGMLPVKPKSLLVSCGLTWRSNFQETWELQGWVMVCSIFGLPQFKILAVPWSICCTCLINYECIHLFNLLPRPNRGNSGLAPAAARHTQLFAQQSDGDLRGSAHWSHLVPGGDHQSAKEGGDGSHPTFFSPPARWGL